MGFEVMREPKAFIKMFEIIICVSSFALITSYKSNMQIDVECFSRQLSHNITDVLVKENVTLTFDIEISYPFKFTETEPQTCGWNEVTLQLEDSTSSQAIFFVIVGSITFIFATCMTFIYICHDKFFADVSYFPVLDLIVHFVFFVLWFSCSIAWSSGISNLKFSTSTEGVIVNNHICQESYLCSVSSSPQLAKLIISVVFGFITLMIFVGNLWLVLKETNMYKKT